jgi:DegV family protein with EDD domain
MAARVAATDEFPTTSQPSVGDFEQAYRRILIDDPSAEILVLTVSSKLSGTRDSAMTAAAQLPDISITVFDTLSVAMGVGLMVMTAAGMIVEGISLPDILTRLTQMRQNLPIFLTVDTLEYLKRGGRIGAAAAFLGTLLDTKPILAVEGGEIRPVGRVRGKKKAVCRLFDELKRKLPAPDHPVQAGVMHAAAEDEAQRLGRMIQERFNITYFFVFELGPVLGTHVGAGAIGTGFCPEIGE